jgi:hypothetical protein
VYLQYGKHEPTPRAMALVALGLYPPLVVGLYSEDDDAVGNGET